MISVVQNMNDMARVSVLFSEPKIPQLHRERSLCTPR